MQPRSVLLAQLRNLRDVAGESASVHLSQAKDYNRALTLILVLFKLRLEGNQVESELIVRCWWDSDDLPTKPYQGTSLNDREVGMQREHRRGTRDSIAGTG